MFKSGLYNIAGGFIRLLLTVVTIPLLIRIIGIEEYGLWTLSTAVIGIIALAEAGLSISSTVFLSRDLASKNNNGIAQTLTITIGAMLILAILVSIGLWTSAPLLVRLFAAETIPQRAVLIENLRIGGVVVSARLLQQVLIGIEQAYQRYGWMNILNTIYSILNSVGLLLVVSFGGRTTSMMVWSALIALILLIAHTIICCFLLRGLHLRPLWSRSRAHEILTYSGMTWLGTLGGVLFSQCDRLIVGSLLGVRVLGIYAAITSITVQINAFSALPVQPLLPALSSMVDTNDDIQLLQFKVKRALQINALVALGMGAGLLTLAPIVISFVIANVPVDELQSIFYSATIIYTLYSLNAVGFYALIGLNKMKAFMIIQFMSGIISLLMIGIGARLFGLSGAVFGNIGYLGSWLLIVFAMKYLHIPLRSWLGWLRFPILWFGVVNVINFAIQFDDSTRIIVFVLQSLLLVTWFCLSQGINMHSFIRRLVAQ